MGESHRPWWMFRPETDRSYVWGYSPRLVIGISNVRKELTGGFSGPFLSVVVGSLMLPTQFPAINYML